MPRLACLVPLLLSLFACGEPTPTPQSSRDVVAPRPAPTPAPAPAPEPEPTPEPEPKPSEAPGLEPLPELDPALDERKQALANVGRTAFEALRTGDFELLLSLTPHVDPHLKQVCAELPIAPRDELEARFGHCHRSIAWAEVAEAQVFAGKPDGTPANGCEPGIEDYGRLQLFLQMAPAAGAKPKIWRVEFFGAVGRDGNAIGINGELGCREVDEMPKLR